ncbi:MAG: hypothetical protein ACE37F_15595 [Nannocystaceae bacterium]|nr:hypothetical protein [bacterium]
MLSAVGLCVGLLACDVSKSVGEEDTTSGGEPPVTMSGEASGAAPGGSGAGPTSASPGSATSTSGGPGTASAGVTTATTGGPRCGVDVSPAGGNFLWECYCSTCLLTYEEISLETMQAFEEQSLCDCLCEAAGCGGVEGEGGVSGGDPTATSGTPPGSSGADTFSSGSTTGEGSASFTYEGCLDEGGVIVGDPGDGSVFEPGYLCPSGEPPMGWLEFEPGMAFPRNGGVCCPPAG